MSALCHWRTLRWGRLKMNRPPTEAAYLYLTTAVKVPLLFAVLEVGHRL